MAAYIPVPRDLTRVKTKVFFNLTKRQLLCFGAAALIGVPIFFLVKATGNVSLAALSMMIVMLPLFFLAMYEKDDEYRYDLDEINHNPYELAAYLTVKFEDYTRDEVQATLQWLFEQQYELTLTEVVEIRTRTTSSTDPETGETTTEEEDYEYYILNVKLRNKGLNSVISNSGLSEDDMERYRILLQTRGNRPDIFGNDIYATPGGEYTDYDIPGEALTDTRFANMIREAEKYLGYPYVWGGSSPSTSFDCSGFVSYVINHCGNGWSVGRLTANGLMGVCDIIPKSSAKPGDLIFFQGTYDTSGASHVGIYVGNGMMIHCGNPISYASIESNYWQQHFYCFGRIRN